VIYGGQGQLADQVFRIAHMGDIDADVERVLADRLAAS
jgi:aspartate aminotransferase-like enzyme